MIRFESVSIKARLLLLTSLSSALGLLVAGSVLGWQNFEVDHRELQERLQTQVNVIASLAAAPVASGDVKALQHTIEALSGDDEIVSAEVRGADGAALVQIAFDRDDGGVPVLVTSEVMIGTKRLGAVHLVGTAREIEEGLVDHALIVLMALAGALAIAMIATSLLHRMISRPVAALSAAKRDLEVAVVNAERAARVKADFLANMSHEIRTPMNGVVGMLDLLHEEALTPEQRSMLETARNSADSLLTLINDVLDVSKIDAGKLTLEKIDVELRPLVEEVATLFSKHAAEKGLEVTCAVHNEVPELIGADPTRLRQIIVNLVGNAVKFTERGEVFVGIQARCEAGTPRVGDTLTVQIIIQDTGIGMEPHVVEGLFAAFSQADTSTTRKYGGTGLGLAITKKLVDAMGGSIKVKSEPGKGSTFSLFIPVEVRARAASKPLASLSTLNVLIVDDNPTNRCILEHYLSHEGARFESTSSARAGLHAAREALGKGCAFDIVLLDYQMPEMDGVGFLRELRADGRLAHTPCVVLSSLGDRVAEAEALGVTAWLTKPVRKKQLHSMLSVAAGSSAAQPSSTASDPARADYTGRRVLLVEDNRVNKEVALRMLERFGIEAATASDGSEGLSRLARERFDLVFMDCQMPNMDGYDATRALRQRERSQGLQRLPIIAMTANALEWDREKCLEAGMDDYLSKPVKRDALATMLARWLGPTGSAGASNTADGTTSALEAVAGVARERIAPAVNLEVIAELKDLMGSGLRAVIETYLSDTPAQLQAMTGALPAGDLPTLGRAAHSLKSSSYSLGAMLVGRLAEALDLYVRGGGSLDEAARRIDDVRVAFEEAAPRLRELARDEARKESLATEAVRPVPFVKAG